jgi:hypothetical protein
MRDETIRCSSRRINGGSRQSQSQPTHYVEEFICTVPPRHATKATNDSCDETELQRTNNKSNDMYSVGDVDTAELAGRLE